MYIWDRVASDEDINTFIRAFLSYKDNRDLVDASQMYGWSYALWLKIDSDARKHFNVVMLRSDEVGGLMDSIRKEQLCIKNHGS